MDTSNSSVAGVAVVSVDSNHMSVMDTSLVLATSTNESVILQKESTDIAVVKRPAFNVKFSGSLGVSIGDLGVIEEGKEVLSLLSKFSKLIH